MMNDPAGGPESNPYQAPTAQPPMAAAAPDKEYRANLINRRTIAVLLEMTLWYSTLGPVLQALLAKISPFLASFSIGVYYVLRDLLGVSALTRQFMGLRLVTGAGTAPTTR